MLTIENLQIKPRAMINSDGLQRVDISCLISRTTHVSLRVSGENDLLERDIALTAGQNDISLLLTPPEEDCKSAWQLSDGGKVLVTVNLLWEKPREWTLYVMVSSHTDIGLHNSQYIQRLNSVKFLDEASALCDQTDTHREIDRYHYTIEGSWFWNNYAADRSHKAAKRIADDYIKTGKIGICAGIAGNHTQVYGFEELCRSTYGRRKLHENWDIDARTLSMIDNNGMSWSIVQPYASAGFSNIIFSPNQWNPLPSTIWPCDKSISGYIWNTDAGGGGSRIDIRYDSALPMLFRWQAADAQSELLVWCAPQYGHGGSAFGFEPDSKPDEVTLTNMALRMAVQLEKIEKHNPYGVWLVACYKDDQQPNLALTDVFALWNERWRSPQIRTLGNPDVPFDYVREHFYERIPVLHGDMTGGWYQHPLAASDLLAKKLNADRRLANAEKFASLAGMLNGDYLFPAEEFSRAWEYLIFNDEHSYGTSGYQGRRVYETWMQHRDWIDKADLTAKLETSRALAAIGSQIKSDGQMLAVFNPTARERDERVAVDGKTAAVMAIPPFGYKTISLSSLTPIEKAVLVSTPPVMENRYYKLQFAENGSICSIYDKELARELIDQTARYGANGFVYTSDNHQTFITAEKARFTLANGDGFTSVTAYIDEPVSGAAITQTVTLDDLTRRIDIDNKLEHVCDMVNTQRYDRYLYYAFPFKVDHAKRFCQLNGCEAAYGVDLTGHGTDVYMAAHEWCCAENEDFGAGLIQLDTQLIEFDHIHPDKTDYGHTGHGSAVYSYVANDWLQMHLPGGSHENFHLRYAITSYRGSHTSALLAETAEKCANPVLTFSLSANRNGKLPADCHSFLDVPADQRFVGMKRAEDGRGLIVRLYGNTETSQIALPSGASTKRVTVDEQPLTKIQSGIGFSTLRVGEESICIKLREPVPDLIDEHTPAPIGSVHTGLITIPRAACGEKSGQLYLLWGQNQEPNLSHYELFRSEVTGFEPSAENLIATVEPGEYRVARYEDTGLGEHTTYCYRVRAVNQSGAVGAFSDEFSGITRETIN